MMISFKDIANMVHDAQEEFAVAVSDGEYVRTNSSDRIRIDYEVATPYGRGKSVTIDASASSFENEVFNFMDANRGLLANKYLHVKPHGVLRELGISNFKGQPQRELIRDESVSIKLPIDIIPNTGNLSKHKDDDFGFEF